MANKLKKSKVTQAKKKYKRDSSRQRAARSDPYSYRVKGQPIRHPDQPR